MRSTIHARPRNPSYPHLCTVVVLPLVEFEPNSNISVMSHVRTYHAGSWYPFTKVTTRSRCTCRYASTHWSFSLHLLYCSVVVVLTVKGNLNTQLRRWVWYSLDAYLSATGHMRSVVGVKSLATPCLTCTTLLKMSHACHVTWSFITLHASQCHIICHMVVMWLDHLSSYMHDSAKMSHGYHVT